MRGKQKKLELCLSVSHSYQFLESLAASSRGRTGSCSLYKRQLLPHLRKSGTAAAPRTLTATKCVINDPVSFQLSCMIMMQND